MKKRKLGIIGGSGLYKMEGFEKTKWKKIKTPWGKPSDEILLASIGKDEICFIPRHSRGHKINPTNINFRANIDAMKQLGVTDIISVSAVGSLKENLEPGKFVIVDQFIDRTFSRVKTFFDEEIVAHVSMAKPTSSGLSNCCEAALNKLNISHQVGGTYVVMEGPQFSTLAESNLYRSWGADVIGMTNMPEAKLAIIGGSGLYDVEEFKERELLDLQTPWGKPSDQILKTKYNGKEVYFFFSKE